MRRTEVVLAVDLGAGSMRAAAVDGRGRLLAMAAVTLRGDEPRPGWSEIDPERWWQALRRCVGRVLDALPRAAAVRGLCFSGLTRAQVLLDRDLVPLRPALLFRDRRAEGDIARVAVHFPSRNPADAVTAFHPLARLAWTARVEPRLFRRLSYVVEPKDFFNARLTGEIAADSVTYSRFDALRRPPAAPGWLQRCLDLLALPRKAPWAPVGRVIAKETPFGRLQGLPVFAGAMDTWAAVTGSGAVLAGQAYDVAGTTEAVGLLGRRRRSVRGLVSIAWGDGLYQVGGPTQIGADAIAWCHRTFRVRGPLAAAVERVARRAPSADLPLLLPYLAGERVPLWRTDIRGAFHRVAREHDPDAFLWATLEGSAHAVRDILSIASTGSGESLREVRVSGGGARSNAWCQLKADVTGLPFVRTPHAEAGLIGAAMAGAVGLGWFSSVGASAARMCPVERVFEPRRKFAGLYAERATLYQQAKEAALAEADAAAARRRTDMV
ncbi:MAG TPA: FGGY-family carbohydrate kinase [Alphaproteobacteria bacterium]|nr:FGGY-family carbohydrate kinase [Alphaproteobacteria bacterium]